MAQIVLLRLGDEMQSSIFNNMYQPLCDDISQKYSTIQAKSAADVRPLLSDPSLQAILVVDGGLTIGKEHIALQKQLSSYAHAGGTIIFCCLFSSFTRPPDFNRMFRSFGLAWEFGDYHRTTFYLSQHIRSILGHQRAIELEREYSMKAVHLKNTLVGSRVYVPHEQSRTQSRVFAPTAVDQGQTPAAFSKHGSGWIGYIGDVNNEEGSRSLVMALLGKSNPRRSGTTVTPICILTSSDLATSTDTSAASKRRSSSSSSTMTTSHNIGCSICGQLTPVMQCSRCHTTQYCSTDCQKADWKEHKIYCGMPSLEPA